MGCDAPQNETKKEVLRSLIAAIPNSVRHAIVNLRRANTSPHSSLILCRTSHKVLVLQFDGGGAARQFVTDEKTIDASTVSDSARFTFHDNLSDRPVGVTVSATATTQATIQEFLNNPSTAVMISRVAANALGT